LTLEKCAAHTLQDDSRGINMDARGVKRSSGERDFLKSLVNCVNRATWSNQSNNDDEINTETSDPGHSAGDSRNFHPTGD
jgi:hypothetical protein